MYLKRLELYGFKSFHEKISLEFDRGITAVVGPNGSGKSNIADAIRWVLGEQSAKSLRGAKMEDVIFSGTQNRRGLGYAEVTLLLDNSCGTLVMPDVSRGLPQYAEVSVTRRLFRSGESQYLINGAAVRLRDVHELFMDTGLGREGYSIIGQGRIEDVLSAKSEDRRTLFEEAAGIVKFKARKTEAVNRLEKERQNLVRAGDIIAELESRVEPLQEMAEKAKKYLTLSEKLKLVQISIFLNMTENHQKEMEAAETNIESLLAQIRDAESRDAARKTDVDEVKKRLELISEAVSAKQGENAGISVLIEKRENDAKLAKQHIEYINMQTSRLGDEIASKAHAANTFEKEKTALCEKLLGMETDSGEDAEKLKTLELELNELTHVLEESEKDLESYNAGHIERLQGVTELKAAAEGLAVLYTQLENRKEELAAEISDINEKLRENTKAFEATEGENARNAEELLAAEHTAENLSTHKTELEETLHAINKLAADAKTLLSDAKSRRAALLELEKSYEGYGYGVKNLLLAAKTSGDAYPGIHGAVGELISAPEKYETCVEIALGGAITDIVTDDEVCAKKAIAFLKATNGGRATFLPLTAVKPRDLGKAKETLTKETGILGVAADFVKTDQKYDGIVQNLLGRVIVADNIDSAVDFSKKFKYEYKVVTLAGELINSGGAITGGSLAKGGRILGRKRELEEIAERIAELEISAAEKSAEAEEAARRLASVSQQLEKSKMLRQEIRIKIASAEAAAANIKKQQKEYQSKKNMLDAQDKEIMSRITAVNREIREKRFLQQASEAEIADLLAEIAKKQEVIRDKKHAVNSKNKVLSDFRAARSRSSEAMLSVKENIKRLESEIASANAATVKIRTEIEALDIEKDEKEALIVEIISEAETLSSGKNANEAETLLLKKEMENAEAELAALQEGGIEAIKKVSTLNVELERLNSKKDRIEADRRRLYDEMWEEYNITPLSARGYERLDLSEGRLKREEQSLKNAIREMGGTVDLGAAEEYRLVKERHELLTKQRDDILEAEKSLLSVIAELERLMEERFREQFAVISENFGMVFAEMFEGGTAYLQLSDAQNVLESGIEIIASPPGKALQSMSLLSGGERALCAIALLFGILKIKPAPFCVLDEIETALDDANVKRFSRFLRNYANTQFIVITHRKGTMEASDALYGVTMQEAGLSKLVSVKFEAQGTA